eukprot:10969028-Ditylum_brightwellii.AAC.1
MEADAALELTKMLYMDKPVLLEKIVADNDSSMKTILQHSYKEKESNKALFPNYIWPRTTNRQKKKGLRQLPLHIPEPQ